MKTFAIWLTVTTTIILLSCISFGIIGTYQYEKKFSSYWKLADKSSTILKKAEYIDKFVNSIERAGFYGKHNAIFMTTPNNSFDHNYEALKTLQQRLHEISKMDVSSFQYQTAIQQITEQEQGEAQEMLSVFRGIWWKENYIFIWGWIGWILVIFSLLGVSFGSYILLEE